MGIYDALMRNVAERSLAKRVGSFAAVVAVGLLASCAQADSTPHGHGDHPVQAARELSDAPELVKTGDATGSCGEFELDQGEALSSSAVECLTTAASAKEHAELAWTFPTVEGDPIVHFAFVAHGSDIVTLHVTNAFDSFGGEPRWSTFSCADAVSATEISSTGCQTS